MLVALLRGGCSSVHRPERRPTCIRHDNSFSGRYLRNNRARRCTAVPRFSSGMEVPMPAVDWFFATIVVMSLCAIAIATPFLLSMGAALWN